MRAFAAALAVVATLVPALSIGSVGGDVEVIKSPNDDAQYRGFVLSNQLKVLVISDPLTDKSAAALAVNVGSGSDPEDRAGLAHFLEHMLFLGTEKYPIPGEYQKFIRAHGGSNNAYTAFEFTNYFFDIDPDHFEPALDRFAQFFIAPLFTPKYVEREINAVDSEYRSKLKNDAHLRIDAQKMVFNPRHPYASFQGGSLETLRGDEERPIRDELIDFYRQHYSANLMALVVIGREPIPVLERWVTERFGQVPDHGAQPLVMSEPLFSPGTLPTRLDIVPNKDDRYAQLTFPIPPVDEHYRSKPTLYIGDLLGHEGKGSLLSLLRSKGWVDGLSAGTGMSNRSAATFNLSMSLTKEGLAHVEEVIEHVFEYLRLVRAEGIRRWTFEELSRLSALDFRFKEKSEPIDYAAGLATNLHLFPFQDVLRGPYALDVFEPDLIAAFLDHLVPENVLLSVVAKGLAANAESRWFAAPYKVSALPATTLSKWKTTPVDGALALPPPNPFIPENLALQPLESATPAPVRIKRDPGFELWHQQDPTFRVPRADFFFTVRSPVSNDTARHAALTGLYVDLVNDALNEFAYPAALAGLSYRLYEHVRGFSVRISGYSDKQALVLDRVVKTLGGLRVDPERFSILKERALRSLRNAQHDRPFTQTLSEVSHLLLEPSWSEEQRADALEPVELAELEAFIPQLLQRLSIVALSHGNLLGEEALELAGLVTRGLLDPAVATPVPNARVVKLSPGARFVRELEIEHDDSAITAYFQGSDKSYAQRAEFGLLTQILASPFYADLRTEKQLGYIVFATSATLLEVPGISFVVQSPVADPGSLEHHTDAFIERYASKLAEMSDAEFEANKSGLLTRILEEERTLQERSSRYWREIDQEHYRFDSREQLARAVREIDRAQFQAFYRRTLIGEKSARIIVRTVGDKHRRAFALHREVEDGLLVPDAQAFRQGREYFSRLAPSAKRPQVERPDAA